MKKSKIKKKALRCIKKLEERASKNSSQLTCIVMPLDYRDFLEEQNILNRRNTSLFYKYFLGHTFVEANLFRMMVVTEYCKQKGIEI